MQRQRQTHLISPSVHHLPGSHKGWFDCWSHEEQAQNKPTTAKCKNMLVRIHSSAPLRSGRVYPPSIPLAYPSMRSCPASRGRLLGLLHPHTPLPRCLERSQLAPVWIASQPVLGKPL